MAERIDAVGIERIGDRDAEAIAFPLQREQAIAGRDGARHEFEGIAGHADVRHVRSHLHPELLREQFSDATSVERPLPDQHRKQPRGRRRKIGVTSDHRTGRPNLDRTQQSAVEGQLNDKIVGGGGGGGGRGTGSHRAGGGLLASEAEEELGVGLRLLQPGDQHLHRLDRTKALHGAPQSVNALQFLGVVDELFFAGP